MRENPLQGLWLTATCLAWTALHPANLEAKCKPGDALPPGDRVVNLDFEGENRSFTLHIPPKYDGRRPLPVVFDLHGSGGTSAGQVAASGFKQVADKYNFILVAPQGYMNFWNGDIAFGTAFEQKINDVGFLKAVVDHVASIANINRGKVYSTGLSNGAAMSNTLGCQAADTFAGIAPVADPLDIGLSTCKPAQPMSVLGFHGYDDAPVPYEGGRGSGPMLPTPFPSIPDTLKAWAMLMGCSGQSELLTIQGMSKCEIYRECGGDAQVGYCSLAGGHNLYSQSVLDIADYAWKFLDQFSMPLPDADGDHIGDEDDNCVEVANPDQADADGDCVGDACECETATDCDNGKFCDGSERCNAGACERASAACPPTESCDESSRMCISAPSASAAAGASGSASEPANAAQAKSATKGAAGTLPTSSAPVAGSTAPPSSTTASATQARASAPVGAAGSDSVASQSQPADATSGCSCHAVGVARGSAELPSVLSWLGFGLLLAGRLRRRAGRSCKAAMLSILTACGGTEPGAPATPAGGTNAVMMPSATAAASGGSATMASPPVANSGSVTQPARGGVGASAAASGANAGNTAGSAAAGSGVANAGTMASGGATAPAAGAAAAAAGAAAPARPTLPPIDDPALPGPFGTMIIATAPGLETHGLFIPAKLGENGIKHPIIVWTNGAGGNSDFYKNLLSHFASHGFFVVVDKMSGGNHDPEIVEQKAGIEWAIAEAARSGSPYAGKLDPDRIAVAGHSLGSVSSFASAAHPSIKSSIHWSAGLTGNPVGADEAWLQGLHAPAAFFCGGAEPRALPRCSGDFDNAPKTVPIFYGTVEGVDHTGVYGEPNAGQWGRAGVAWFRFTLAGDESLREWFQAPSCTLCSSPWMGKSRNI